ncbi:MAG: class I SAM-dependent methyltransferase [Armatimonadetes bacterium]|nr:class I SAM-dependent methyltransferase [Armatimonadota bacterium]
MNANPCDPADLPEVDYDLDYHYNLYGRYLPRKRRTAGHRWRVLSAMHPERGDFLDIGPSYGYMLEAGNQVGWRTHGVDLAQPMVDLAKQNGLDIRLGSMTAMPFEDQSIDLVHARHVLEHDIEVYRALAEMKRVMRPGGLLMVEVPDGNNWRARRRTAFEVTTWPHQHMLTMARTHLAGFMARVGLEPVDEVGFVPGPLGFLIWRSHKLFRERSGLARHFITWWRRPE